jgi:TonB-linked SusC/RagA family outer membrane protein
MESVVVVGYGNQKKVNLIGAVNQVDAEALQDRVAPTVAHMLQGTVPGLNITTSSGRPGNTAAVNIRGVTSINGGSPLILIDGAEGDLTRINSNDVESISVIKDASAAAIYGARAAYGVILVTTKSGKEGKTSINYSGRFGWNENTTSTEYESRGYYSVYINNLFWRNDSGTTNYANYTDQDMEKLWERRNDKTEHPDRPWVIQEKRNGKDVYSMYANTDWYHWLYQDKRPMMNHALSITGGNDKVRYMVSGNIYNEEGMFRKNPDNLQRLNFRSKLDFNVTDWFKVTNNTSFYSQKYSYPGVSGAETSFSLMTVHALASYVPILPDGGSLYKTQYNTYTIMDGMVVYMEKDGHRNVDKNQTFTNTTEFTLTPVKGLSIVGNFTYKMNNNRTMNRVVNGSYSASPGNIVNITTGSYFKDKLYETYSNHDYYQVNLFATYENTFGKHHNFKAMAGYNYETKYLKDIKSTGYHSFSETLDDFNLLGTKDDGEKELALSGGQNEYALMGYFARLNYDYKGKYLVELSGRYDGTSRFARGQRWGFFPSASVGWRVSEEGFFEPIKGWFNNLKIRYSHGQLGNQNVGYYDYIQKISFAL